ncbi:hypothetical protein SmJEL517_g02509 [Synchytrium microbalum]|uniref:Cyclic nucleotide-binding domain-containing protein n=1 Tax=Synchytrium microbalum TaxID=1806994 RepID=A0A507C7G9_9FUNG|nr:uncharacterized protein SmJEL517_g02509 [Synchytrium microbalum]TPX35089.1 hypothetical protein SmJEL517_g02509 [Synchytrium microbalum]
MPQQDLHRPLTSHADEARIDARKFLNERAQKQFYKDFRDGIEYLEQQKVRDAASRQQSRQPSKFLITALDMARPSIDPTRAPSLMMTRPSITDDEIAEDEPDEYSSSPQIMIRVSSDDEGLPEQQQTEQQKEQQPLHLPNPLQMKQLPRPTALSVTKQQSRRGSTIESRSASVVSTRKKGTSTRAAAKLRRAFVLVRHFIRFVKILAKPLSRMFEKGWDYYDAFRDEPTDLRNHSLISATGLAASIGNVGISAAASLLMISGSPNSSITQPMQQQYSGSLPDTMRDLLKKKPMDRTSHDIAMLQYFFTPMRAFAKWPVEGQMHFLKVGRYERWGANRMLVREGDPVGNMYIMINGNASVLQNQKNDENAPKRPNGDKAVFFDKTLMMVVAELGAGACIGELAFVSNIPKRSATIMTKTACEFLSVDKAAVDFVLGMSRAQSDQRNLKLLSRFPILKTMSADPATLMRYCTFKKYMSESVVSAEGAATGNAAVHFILSGHCRVIKVLPFVQLKLPNGSAVLKAPPPGVDINSPKFVETLPSNMSIVHRPIVVKIINVGEMFGEGPIPGLVYTTEGETGRHGISQRLSWDNVSVVTSSCVECLSILTVDFRMFATDLTKAKLAEMDSNSQRLSLDDVASEFSNNRRWYGYKRGVLMEVVRTSARLQDLMKRLDGETT